MNVVAFSPQPKRYPLMNDTLYRHGVDSVLRHFLTHEEYDIILNDCHPRACGSHPSGLATAQKILRADYFFPSIFNHCIEIANK